MRDLKDTKGVGLMIINKKNSIFKLNKKETNHSDILLTMCSMINFEFMIILVYFACDNNERNKKISSEVERLIRKYENMPVLILGDMNAHVGFLGPQKLNNNGRIILDWLDRLDLTLLNLDVNCQGEITWC